MANINALVDYVEHPDIPYLDEEHLLVGSINFLVTLLFILILERYLYYLYDALGKIKTLEHFLSICANCKKIRIPGSDADSPDSWQQIEFYISKHTDTKFSHGICPECQLKLYPEIFDHPK